MNVIHFWMWFVVRYSSLTIGYCWMWAVVDYSALLTVGRRCMWCVVGGALLTVGRCWLWGVVVCGTLLAVVCCWLWGVVVCGALDDYAWLAVVRCWLGRCWLWGVFDCGAFFDCDALLTVGRCWMCCVIECWALLTVRSSRRCRSRQQSNMRAIASRFGGEYGNPAPSREPNALGPDCVASSTPASSNMDTRSGVIA